MKWLDRLVGVEKTFKAGICQECKVLFAKTENQKYDDWCSAHRPAQVERIELEIWGAEWAKRNLGKIKEFKRQEDAERSKQYQENLATLAAYQQGAQAAQFGGNQIVLK